LAHRIAAEDSMNTASQAIETLDVRVLVPIERHKKLLKMFRDLPVGESFIFINDHDPMPLFYEFRSAHGDVVGWDYLQRGGTDWRVQVTRLEASKGRGDSGVATLMDLRKVDGKARKYVISHRYGMMEEGDTMEIIAAEEPQDIRALFEQSFAGQYAWVVRKSEPGEIVVHVTKQAARMTAADSIPVVKDFDVRPYPPAQRHDLVFGAFDELQPGQAFVFTNDHDPKPLYYQIEAESREPFTWEYLESGPDAWMVKVAKTG
jgi:uncharacterized protein (DUF2249 family)